MNTRLNHIQNWPVLAREAKWSAAVLAKKCGISLRTLERYFLKEMGKCPQVWLSEQRQCRAIELIRDGCTVKAAAVSLGYKHANHFSREYKKYWGHCPTTKPRLLQLQRSKCRVLV
jgi:AraC-like DNA-binding protein